MLPADIIKRYRIKDGRKFRLADIDPGDTAGLDIDKSDAKELLAQSAKRLGDLAGEALRRAPLGDPRHPARIWTRRERTASSST